jgi:hypothetical protein
MIDASLDADRCFDMAEAGLSTEWYLDLAEQADLPADAMIGFLESAAYTANPKAWDWANCLQFYGWSCTGMTGGRTPNTTPPTSCSSNPASGQASLTSENPFM